MAYMSVHVNDKEKCRFACTEFLEMLVSHTIFNVVMSLFNDSKNCHVTIKKK